jgi:ribosomal protein S27AE
MPATRLARSFPVGRPSDPASRLGWTSTSCSHVRCRRFAPGDVRGAKVFCGGCGDLLEYEVGSIAWSHAERDLCGSCAGTEAAERFGRELMDRLKNLDVRP